MDLTLGAIIINLNIKLENFTYKSSICLFKWTLNTKQMSPKCINIKNQ